MAKKKAVTYVSAAIIEYRDANYGLHRLEVGEAVPDDMTDADKEALIGSKSIVEQEESDEFIQD